MSMTSGCIFDVSEIKFHNFVTTVLEQTVSALQMDSGLPCFLFVPQCYTLAHNGGEISTTGPWGRSKESKNRTDTRPIRLQAFYSSSHQPPLKASTNHFCTPGSSFPPSSLRSCPRIQPPPQNHSESLYNRSCNRMYRHLPCRKLSPY